MNHCEVWALKVLSISIFTAVTERATDEKNANHFASQSDKLTDESYVVEDVSSKPTKVLVNYSACSTKCAISGLEGESTNQWTRRPGSQVTVLSMPRRQFNLLCRTKSDSAIGCSENNVPSPLTSDVLRSGGLSPVLLQLRNKTASHQNEAATTSNGSQLRKRKMKSDEDAQFPVKKSASGTYNLSRGGSNAVSPVVTLSFKNDVVNRCAAELAKSARRAVLAQRSSDSQPVCVIPLTSSNIANVKSDPPNANVEDGSPTFQRPVIVVKRVYKKPANNVAV